MKYPKLIQQTDCRVSVQHEYGRIEPMVVAAPGAAPQLVDQHARVVRRMVRCYEALQGLSDRTLDELVDRGGGKSGNAAERCIAWSLFTAFAGASARRYMTKAREIIEKENQ